MDNNTDEFYERLKEELRATSDWPSTYLYKFIVPSSKEKVEAIEKMFDLMGAIIDTKQSKTGKYTSISINVQMDDPESVVQKYKEVSTIEGVIAL